MSAFIEWNEEVYSVGIVKMDQQHKQLIGLINALHAHRDSNDKVFIDRVFTTLITYTKLHFVDEEKILKKLHYSRLQSHQHQHFAFVTTLNGMKATYDKHGPSHETLDNLTKFLKDWLTKHILVEDRAYRIYLES